MATTRAIIKRRKAVRSIHKITRAMEMIATVKFQRFRKEAARTRPFAQILRRIVADLAVDVATAAPASPLLGAPAMRKASNRLALLVISSNRGLAGGYNGAVIRAASAFIDEDRKSTRLNSSHSQISYA